MCGRKPPSAFRATCWVGEDVAFLTQGDPLLYGSFMYVMVKVQALHPEIPIEVVPGVTSITASASRAKIPLVSHAERLAVLPAMYGIDDLRDVLERNDTVVLMKVNRRAMAAVSQLEADGELSRCVFVRRATHATRESRVQPARNIAIGNGLLLDADIEQSQQ